MTSAPGPHEQALREALSFFNERIEDYLVDPGTPLPPLWADDLEFINFEPSPFPGTYHGLEGARRWIKDIFGEFTDSRLDLLDAAEEGDTVAARLKVTARGRSSGVPGSLEWGTLFTMRDGKCVRAVSDISYERTLERFRD